MTIPRDVILDLLPVYLAGDASEATRSLIEEHLRTDADLAARVRAASTMSVGLDSPQVPPNLEMRSLRNARRRLTGMRWLFGLACWFSAVSLGIQLDRDEGRVRATLLLLRHPSVMIYPAVIALACWALYFFQRWRRQVV